MEDRYRPILVTQRPLSELYGLHEALFDLIDVATSPMRDEEEYQISREVVVEIALPSCIVVEWEDVYAANIRWEVRKDEASLIAFVYALLNRVEGQIDKLGGTTFPVLSL